MSKLKIKHLTEHSTGEKFYPVTHIDAVSGLNKELSKRQLRLVSGETIKTVNGFSILGSGDIQMIGGGAGSILSPSVLYPYMYIDASGYLSIDVPEETDYNKNVGIDEEGFLFFNMPEI